MVTKVLVVEDNISISCIVQQMLVDKGFEVSAAVDAQEGYLAFLNNRPDVILTDIQMLGENGLELMKRIRIHEPAVRAIYMSGDWISFKSAIEEEERKFRTRFLRKPFSEDELMKLLFDCVHSRATYKNLLFGKPRDKNALIQA